MQGKLENALMHGTIKSLKTQERKKLNEMPQGCSCTAGLE
jgi:hypothetical protein